MGHLGFSLWLKGCVAMAAIALVGCVATRPGSPLPAKRAAQHRPAVVWTPVRMDPAHPLALAAYYPLLSRRLMEEGSCRVRIEVDVDGRISAAQLLTSTGFARLDQACLRLIRHAQFKAATENGKPVEVWTSVPIIWQITKNGYHEVPQVPHFYHFEVGTRYYPESARQADQEGSCLVRALINAHGKPTKVTVQRSTGSAALDKACIRAVKAAPFLPARDVNGVAHQASTDINLIWRLPGH